MNIGDQIILKPRAIGSDGEGVASLEGFIIFVDGALVGEEVLAEITSLSKNFAKAKVVKILQASPDRIQPPCPVFGKCGGCQLQHLKYEAQLKVKKQRVIDALNRIGHLKEVAVADCVPSPQSFGYRNKIQMPVQGTTLGLYARGSHNVIPIEHCLIHNSVGEKVFQQIKHLSLPEGKIRYILIKSSEKLQESMVVLVTTTGIDDKFVESLNNVVENINQREDNVILGDHFRVIKGNGYIEEELCGKRFRISPHSFFQVNTPQAENMLHKVVEFLGTGKVLVDAFCGVGTLAIIASANFEKVIGIECVSPAIQDAKGNAQRNGVSNCIFKVGYAEQELPQIKHVDAVFLNPPRKGCDQGLLKTLLKQKPDQIVYMSCHPETLARDLAILQEGYSIDEIIPYDMFPQTTHVETLVKLTR